MLGFLKDNFDLFGRRNRAQYITAFAVAIVTFLVAVEIIRDLPPVGVQFLNLFMWATWLFFFSNFIRRLRDTGMGSVLMLIVFGSLAYIFLQVSQPHWAVLVYLGAVFVLPMLVPAWDRANGGTHILATLRQIAKQDGEISEQERKVFEQLLDEPFGMEKDDKQLAIRNFTWGHQDSIPATKHAEKFSKRFGKIEGYREDFARMVWMMANANGKPSTGRADLARQVSTTLGVNPDEFSDPRYSGRTKSANSETDILPPRAKNIVGLLAKMAKADGVIEKAELQMVSDFFDYGMQLPPEVKKAAITYFREVKDDGRSYKHYADLCIRDVTQIPASEADEAKNGIFGLLLELASADGEIHEREAEILEYVADKFGISDEFGGGQQSDTGAGNRSEQTSSASGRKDEQHYAKILQISPDASKDEIKKAWREMIKSNHPDKVSHMSLAIQEFAAEQTKLAQEAYEFFKQRGRV